MRSGIKRRERKTAVKSELKTLAKKLDKHLKGKAAPETQSAYRLLAKRLDQAARRGIIHPNAASRKKARLAKQLAALSS